VHHFSGEQQPPRYTATRHQNQNAGFVEWFPKEGRRFDASGAHGP
jgi:hypothetical protein